VVTVADPSTAWGAHREVLLLLHPILFLAFRFKILLECASAFGGLIQFFRASENAAGRRGTNHSITVNALFLFNIPAPVLSIIFKRIEEMGHIL
jgi:hypothetical protein